MDGARLLGTHEASLLELFLFNSCWSIITLRTGETLGSHPMERPARLFKQRRDRTGLKVVSRDEAVLLMVRAANKKQFGMVNKLQGPEMEAR